jgi:glycosyltransferase involved in cell wall biosynthesis
MRLNQVPPMDRHMEPDAVDEPVDLLFVHPGSTTPEPRARIRRSVGPYLGHRPEVIGLGDDEVRRRTRREFGLPDAPLIVGWGADGWLDGPDVFIRVLWALRRRGTDAHGVWFGLGADGNELDRLTSEAARCGVAEHMHFRPDITLAARLCGDAVLNCDRSPGRSPEEIVEALVSGSAVVAFPMIDVADEGIEFVPMLDVDAAAAALERVLSSSGVAERATRREEARVRLDVCGSFDQMYSLGGVARG